MDEETYEIMIEDLAFWLVNNHDACPLIFTNDQVQAKLYKYYQDIRRNKGEKIMDEFNQEVQRLYDEYLMKTEKRGISYGEIAYIEGLSKKELNKLYEELLKEGE